MAFSSLKLTSYSPLPRSLAGQRDSSSRPVACFSTGEHRLQGKRQNIVKATLKQDNGISRREALSLVTGTVLMTSFVPVNSASARVSKPGIREKIMEKLDQLRGKAGSKKEEKTEPKLEKKEEKKEPKVEKKEEKKEAKVEKEEAKVEKKEEKKEAKVEKKESPLLVPPVESSVF